MQRAPPPSAAAATTATTATITQPQQAVKYDWLGTSRWATPSLRGKHVSDTSEASAPPSACSFPTRQLPDVLAAQIQEDLKPWHNITLQHVEHSYCSAGSSGFRIQVRSIHTRQLV